MAGSLASFSGVRLYNIHHLTPISPCPSPRVAEPGIVGHPTSGKGDTLAFNAISSEYPQTWPVLAPNQKTLNK